MVRQGKKIIKKEKPDIAIGYTIKPNIYGGMASRIRKTPFIANVTGLGSAYYKGGMLKKIVSTLYKVGLKNRGIGSGCLAAASA